MVEKERKGKKEREKTKAKERINRVDPERCNEKHRKARRNDSEKRDIYHIG